MRNRTAAVRKQKFLEGAGILTVGMLLNKAISAIYKLPLTRLIGSEAVGHFSVAYNVYDLMMSIAAAGLPVAVSRLIAEAAAQNRRRQIQRTFAVSLAVFLLIGLLGGGSLLIFSHQIARRMSDTAAAASLRALAPGVLFVCIFCAFRGYYQGQQYMTPTAVSQIVEAVCKLGVGIGAAIAAVRLGFGPGASAACAVAGVSAGAGLSCVYLVLVYRRSRVLPGAGDGELLSRRRTLAKLLQIALPITLGAAGLQIFKLVGAGEILSGLQGPIGLSQTEAVKLFAVYALSVTVFQLPGTIVQPIGVSLVAGVTEKITVDDAAGRRQLEESALRMTALLAFPCGFGMLAIAGPIQALLFGYQGQTLRTAAVLLQILSPAAICFCFLVLTNALLQARGRVMVPVYHTLAGGALYLLLCRALVVRPGLHIYGAAIATLTYTALIPALNLIAICRRRQTAPRLWRQLWKPALSAACMSAAAWWIQRLSGSILLSTVTAEDCRLLPHGAAIARLLRLKDDSNGGT